MRRLETIAEMNARGEAALGIFVGSTDPSITESVAAAGYDFVVIDCEHTPMDPLTTLPHVRAAEAAGIRVFARLWDLSPAAVQRFLDIDVQGLIIPHADSAESVEAVVAATRRPPRGVRGTCPIVRGAGYSREGWDEYVASSEEDIFISPIIESAAGLENVDAIAAVEGVDLVYLGAVDLAAEMGVPVASPEIADAWRSVAAAAERHGKRAMGPLLPDVDQSEAGAFVLGMDLGVLTASLRQLLDSTAPAVRKRMRAG
ncbi:HpcH/HpaI aldolase family protein [Nocardioides immobilis]|uniref:HpcH/HpaI aldolase family protein n=1 Tax=Nocardioides immobilis TaxID=2049295 RepID=UPI0015FB57E2|nr:aldolase/citrate lyase family protein [Nocardioides immobilis]